MLVAYGAATLIRIDVEDECGGLAVADPESMFVAFSQSGRDRSGLGLGLSIARRSVETFNGTLNVRDMPGKGCVFTVDLPRAELHERTLKTPEHVADNRVDGHARVQVVAHGKACLPDQVLP